MCEPLTMSSGLALAGMATSAAASGVGMYMNNQAQQAQAEALRNQNYATQSAQSSAFYDRMGAARRQSDAQFGIMQQGLADQKAATDQMRAREGAAVDQRQQILAATNTQADALRARGDAAGAALLEQTNREALDKAQQDRLSQAQLLLDQSGAVPGVPGAGPVGPTAGDPGAGSTSTSTGSADTDSAVSRRMAQAATNIRTYGQELAKTAGYAQPLNTVGIATTDTGTGIMPAQAADKLLSTGTPIRLLPAQLAYRNAADAGQAQIAALQANQQGQLGLAGLDYSNTVGGASLAQANATTTAANQAAQAKQDALWGQQMGGILSGIGNLGMYASGYYGGGPSWLKPSVPGAPKIT